MEQVCRYTAHPSQCYIQLIDIDPGVIKLDPWLEPFREALQNRFNFVEGWIKTINETEGGLERFSKVGFQLSIPLNWSWACEWEPYSLTMCYIGLRELWLNCPRERRHNLPRMGSQCRTGPSSGRFQYVYVQGFLKKTFTECNRQLGFHGYSNDKKRFWCMGGYASSKGRIPRDSTQQQSQGTYIPDHNYNYGR